METDVRLKPRPNYRNIPTQHIATLLGEIGHRVKMCCDMLTAVGSSFKLKPNARNMLRPTMLRYDALACCDRFTRVDVYVRRFVFVF